MEPRGRGRGYGRARGNPNQQQQYPPQRPGFGGPRQQQAPAPDPRQPPRGPPQSAWARPPQAAPAWVRPPAGAPPQAVQQPLGRGGRQAGDDPSQGAIPRRVVGEGDQAMSTAPSTRGAGGNNVRGRVVNRTEILFTKPKTMTSKQGTSGAAINLLANYLPLIHKGKWCLYQYRVDFNPDTDITSERKKLVRIATKEILRGGYLFDGTVLYTPQRINPDSVDLFVQNDKEENVRITIRLVGDVAWGDRHYIQLFNIIIRKCLALMGLQQVGRNYYMPDNKVVLREHRIQLWPGYFTSMRQHERDILLNVDLQFKFMRTDNVYDLLMEECQGANMKKEFQEKVIGCVVLTYYNNKTYKIDDVDFNSSPESTFKKADGSEITYRKYYQDKYKVNIRDSRQPMLISRSKPREIRAGMPETVYLVPELCQMTGLTDKQRENFNLMKQLATHTRVGPDGRIAKLLEFSDKIHRKPEVVEEIRRWDLGIGDSLVRFKGRVLNPEGIFGAKDDRFSAGPQADWTRELRARPMLYSPTVDKLLVLCPGRLKGPTQDFMQVMGKVVNGLRWRFGRMEIIDLPDDRASSYIRYVDSIKESDLPKLILTVLPSNSQDRYGAIKKKCCVDRAIPTQMVVARNFNSKGVMSIATKMAIQMNCKVGGAPWSVSVPLSHLMVVGYDVCRDTSNRKKSFSGMVASLDKQLTRYFSYTSEHEMEEELSNNFAAFMVMACKKYKEINGQYPERILIYRDGVGEGQLEYVYEHEVTRIKERLKQEIYQNSELKFAFVVVSKRINTRIFTDRKDNPPPGTVVDDTVTLPERYDFYLVSQCVRQGTVSPTSYNIIDDTLGLTPDKMQVLTYKLTHLYFNWSGTVRVPAPCQYAHKLAFMVSQHLHRPAHPDLDTLLYYL